MYQSVCISPSILSADFMNLGDDISRIEQAGARFVHVDVMDGHFVSNITIGIPLVTQLKATTSLPLDVHLMVSNPLSQIPWFLDAGADSLTLHVEAFADEEEMFRAIEVIHAAGRLAAFAVKPTSDIGILSPFLQFLDMVLVMTVQPGFSGQSFIEGSEARVQSVRNHCRDLDCSPLIEVDGGICEATAPLVCAAGADVLVCGNAVFKTSDVASAISRIVECAERARLSCTAASFEK